MPFGILQRPVHNAILHRRDMGGFLPVSMRSEKSSCETFRRASGGPKKATSTATYSSDESVASGVAIACSVYSAAMVTLPACACAWYSFGDGRGGMPFSDDSFAAASCGGAVWQRAAAQHENRGQVRKKNENCIFS